jgi:hypothetical protein
MMKEKTDDYVTVLRTPNGYMVAFMRCTSTQEEEYQLVITWHRKDKVAADNLAVRVADMYHTEVR